MCIINRLTYKCGCEQVPDDNNIDIKITGQCEPSRKASHQAGAFIPCSPWQQKMMTLFYNCQGCATGAKFSPELGKKGLGEERYARATREWKPRDCALCGKRFEEGEGEKRVEA